ncbi:hypothetical protein ABZ470_31935 [Streptosporangium sp. NPDC020072]|uniref:hypothetical protein n=1 Tax=Streptosporangium sp. NPDC020072 TaxID=3154788 RepID=UPI003445927E
MSLGVVYDGIIRVLVGGQFFQVAGLVEVTSGDKWAFQLLNRNEVLTVPESQIQGLVWEADEYEVMSAAAKLMDTPNVLSDLEKAFTSLPMAA